MSYSMFPFGNEDLLNGLPSLNRIQNTLLMIETIKSIPNHSLTCLDPLPSQNEDEDSLAAEIKQFNAPSIQTPEAKKKKVGCTCKKTKCLKRYCECFSSGKICTPECACYGCFNTHTHEDLIQRTKVSIKTKSSRKNTQGCTCKKSQCQKKYCECYNAGRVCSSACKCKDCENLGGSCSSHISAQDPLEMIGQKNSQQNQIEPKEMLPKFMGSFSNLGFNSAFQF